MSPALLVVAAAILWGTTGTAQALGPDGIDPLVVGWVRMAVGGVALVVIAGVRTRRARAGRLPRGWHAVAVLSVAAYQLTFFGGVRLAGVALGTAVGIGSAPVWGGLVDFGFLRWHPSARWLGATSVAVAGAVLVAGDPGDAERPALGLALALGAGASYALYAYALQQLSRIGDPDRVAASTFFGASILLAPVALLGAGVGELGRLFTLRGSLMALHLGLVATGASYALFTRGIRRTPVSQATVLSLAEPLTAVVLGLLVLGESLTPTASVGILLLLTGVIAASTDRLPTTVITEH